MFASPDAGVVFSEYEVHFHMDNGSIIILSSTVGYGGRMVVSLVEQYNGHGRLAAIWKDQVDSNAEADEIFAEYISIIENSDSVTVLSKDRVK